MALLVFPAAEMVVVVDVLVDSAAVVVSDLVDSAVVRFPCSVAFGFRAGAASPHCHSVIDHVLVNHR